MSSRVFVVMLALAIAPMPMASESSSEVLPHHTIALNAQVLRPTLTVSDLFAEKANRQYETRADGTMVVTAPSIDVIVMRINADGEVETACVSDEKSANAFLNAEAKQKRTITAAAQEK